MARKKQKIPLSSARIETAALELIEKKGLEAFSTRKLAAALGCEAMSIYHYFPSKAHLVDALLNRVLAEMVFLPADRPWLERLRNLAHAYRAMALRHPAFFPFMAHHRMNTRPALGFLEQALAIFDDAGLNIEEAARLFRAFSYYVTGAALDETIGYAKGSSATESVPDDEAVRDFPLVTAVNPYFRVAEHDTTFDLGLEILLDGITDRRPASGAEISSHARRKRSSAK